jgi:hypothetical protein
MFEKEREQGIVLSAMELSDFFLSVDSDDEAKIPAGNPGRFIDNNALPHGSILDDVDQSQSNGGPT